MRSAKRQLVQRRRRRDDTLPGHDSFLDIVANLVGILIILVVVVGAQAGAALVPAAPSESTTASLQAKTEELAKQLETEKLKSLSLNDDRAKLEANIQTEELQVQALRMERQALLVELQTQQRQSEELLAQQSDVDQRQQKWRLRIAQLEQELDTRRDQLHLLQSNAETRRAQIIHYPTPLAKTVFSEEIHFRIKQGKISYVPLDELIDLMRKEWKIKAEKLKTRDQTTEVVGPIANFHLQYELVAEINPITTELGTYSERHVALKQFSLIPTPDQIGEPVETALGEDSQFSQRVAALDPRRVTISIWTYPDSYPEFNRIKTFLRQQGFQTAVWPLNRGKLISGGPDGYRSAAQ